jgi:paraquat-inducible protein B
MRARLANASIFTGGLKVELATVPGAPEATLGRDAEPLPRIPTAPAAVTDVGATAQGVLQRVNDLPIEEVMQSVTDFLNNASALIGSEDLQRAPAELTGILSAVRGVAESDGVQNIPDQISGLLDDLQGTSDTLNRVIAVLEEQDAAGKLTTAIENVGTASETLPDLVADIRAVLQNAEEVPLVDLSQDVSELLTSAEAMLADIDALVAGEAIQALPGELRGIMSSVRGITESADVQALPTRVTQLLTGLQDSSATLSRLLRDVETQDTVGKLTAAVDDVAQAADGLPAIVEQARGIVENANQIPLDRLSDQATQLLASANALVDQESTRALPGELNAALQSVQEVLSELQDGGLVNNANNTLASASAAADAIAEASATLPRLAADLRAVATQAGTTLSTYADDSSFTRETRGAIRQIQSAAEAIERLARTIERNPNSLILGR